jgi:hypothetical protein
MQEKMNIFARTLAKAEEVCYTVCIVFCADDANK